MIPKLLRSLLPNGWAFKLWPDTNFRNVVDALAEEPKRIKTFFDLVRDSGIPSVNMSTDCLNEWETFLGLKYYVALSTQERIQRVIAKFSANGGQGIDTIQNYLHSAGFPLYIVENFAYTDPRTVPGTLISGPRVWRTRKRYKCTCGGFTCGSGMTMGRYIGTKLPRCNTQFQTIQLHGYIFGYYAGREVTEISLISLITEKMTLGILSIY
jgi:Uncharacterised protein conserved in bacteria (DUF2313)